MCLLMGLNVTFSQIRGQILLLDSLPPINRVFAFLSQEEHQRKSATSQNTRGALIYYFAKSYSDFSYVGDVSIGLNLTLKDVLFVPEFKFNLLSVSTLLLSTDFPVSFCADHFIIQDLSQ